LGEGHEEPPHQRLAHANACIRECDIQADAVFVSMSVGIDPHISMATVRKSIKRLEDIEKMETDGVMKELNKKEVLGLNKEHAKLEAIFGGIRHMKALPGALFVSDTEHEHIAVHEANRLKIPVFGIVDSNSNPDQLADPLPGNVDALKSVSLLTRVIADALAGTPDANLAPAAEAAPVEEAAANV
jgi:small subunit ribosomal protein S2